MGPLQDRADDEGDQVVGQLVFAELQWGRSKTERMTRVRPRSLVVLPDASMGPLQDRADDVGPQVDDAAGAEHPASMGPLHDRADDLTATEEAATADSSFNGAAP